MRKVDINYLDFEKDEEVKKEITIRPARVREYKTIAKIVGGVTRKIKEDPYMVEALQSQIFGVSDDSWKDKEARVLLDEVQDRLNAGYISFIGFGLEYLPDELTELLSALSHQPEDVIDGMDEESLFAVAGAIVEVNDLGKLQNSFKKFSDVLKSKSKKEKAKVDHQEHSKEAAQ